MKIVDWIKTFENKGGYIWWSSYIGNLRLWFSGRTRPCQG